MKYSFLGGFGRVPAAGAPESKVLEDSERKPHRKPPELGPPFQRISKAERDVCILLSRQNL
jgi:hypothetical protein